MALAAGESVEGGVGFGGQFELPENVGRCAGVAVERRKKHQCLAGRDLILECGGLKLCAEDLLARAG